MGVFEKNTPTYFLCKKVEIDPTGGNCLEY